MLKGEHRAPAVNTLSDTPAAKSVRFVSGGHLQRPQVVSRRSFRVLRCAGCCAARVTKLRRPATRRGKDAASAFFRCTYIADLTCRFGSRLQNARCR